ncbi:PIG-L family deacetylase [Cellulomonas marina]|uniref:N-acetyl-1-D-myo-inositol-2-amino-2-deoxy-alpha-D-glucopyranoside deacetylase n=1 Tax=Cellulomonas marina TaxID=988821 RepID=A0A1I0ZJE1_9CELL|nr:PIG-L family deacetylase [Cellulomonas marina]GIG28599.1 1D-myo-inositol 2-acetamido-2-deoxy-alpha-D-glucopyranoside deacetylase [Cellulomonas marina]SFB25226.1 N-acetyl-1-D-myo-inositol-2-amino-2-deoxy-alpha-D-glucopyranoside deacetylase [Cellulomonas marina]
MSTRPPGAPEGTTGGLVAVHAHPDDETLATGALLATWAAAGRDVVVVTCTRGERGEVIGETLAHLEGDGPALAAHRERELAAARAALGVRGVFLDTLPDERAAWSGAGAGADEGGDDVAHEPAARYEDSGMVWTGSGRAGATADVPAGAFVAVPLDEAARRLAGLLRAVRPAVVVTYDPEGGYGHPDHVRAHAVTHRALRLAARGDDGVHPTVLHAAQGERELRAGRAALADPAVEAALGDESAALTLPDPAGPVPPVAVDDERVDVRVPVGPVRDRVLAALRAHATQVRAVRALDGPAPLAGCWALSNDVLAPLLAEEGYVRVTTA